MADAMATTITCPATRSLDRLCLFIYHYQWAVGSGQWSSVLCTVECELGDPSSDHVFSES
jgi:hypothetical protein